MSKLIGIIDYRDGWMCVKTTDNDLDKPQKCISWWPIEREYPGERNVLDLTGNEAEIEDGLVMFRMTKEKAWNWAKRRPLSDGGKTFPIATEVVPIVCPKVRKGISTRYRLGRWEKGLRSGWTVA
jgi:hypothetical protein